MNYLVTLASHGEDGTIDRTESLDLLKYQCKEFGIKVDDRFIWDWTRFKTTHLYQAYKHIMTMEHRLGYWMWKPYLILDAMYQLKKNDIVCWIDSDLGLTNDPALYITEVAKTKVKLLGSAFINNHYTHEDCFLGMNMTESKYRNCNQVYGAVIFVSVFPAAMKFMTDWLVYCTNETILYPIVHPERTRAAQSILTNLAVHEGVDITDHKDRMIFMHPPC